MFSGVKTEYLDELCASLTESFESCKNEEQRSDLHEGMLKTMKEKVIQGFKLVVYDKIIETRKTKRLSCQEFQFKVFLKMSFENNMV